MLINSIYPLGGPIIIILCLLIVAGAIVSIIKKVAKLGILLLIVACVLTYGGIATQQIKNDYNIQKSGSDICMTIKGTKIYLDDSKIKDAVVVSGENGNSIVLKDKEGKTHIVEVPKVVWRHLSNELEQYGYE